MGLQEVVADVQRDGEARAQNVLDEARRQADALQAEAKAKADEYARQRRGQAEHDAAQLRAQVLSAAEFEARKQVLQAQSELREDMRRRLVEGFSKLPEDIRRGHIEKLLQQADAAVPKGRVWAAEQDLVHVQGREVAGAAPIAGGLIVESLDGTQRLDLSYETLLQDLWRDILKAEADLFT